MNRYDYDSDDDEDSTADGRDDVVGRLDDFVLQLTTAKLVELEARLEAIDRAIEHERACRRATSFVDTCVDALVFVCVSFFLFKALTVIASALFET